MSSKTVCKACVLLEGLNAGLPQMGIGNAEKVRRSRKDDAAEASFNPTIQHMEELRLGSDIKAPE